MPKSVHIIIGNTFLGTLILLSLVAFNMVPSKAAPAAQASGRRRNSRDENGVETLAGSRPHPPAEASTLVRSSLDQQIELTENLNPIAAQGANFVVNYDPPSGCTTSGLPNFLPPDMDTSDQFPQAAKDAFEYALRIWRMLLDANQTIVINACWVDPGGTNPLGTGQPVSAFANFDNAPFADTMYPVALANELAGTDLNDNDDGPLNDHDGDGNPADAEIIIAFNSTTNWYFGTDANPGSQQDFVTVALHEIAHGLGFASTMDVDTGAGECGTSNAGDGCWSIASELQDMPVIFDRFVVSGGLNLINTDVFSNPSSELGDALTSNSVFFDGPNANAATGGGNPPKPKLHAPGTFLPGSSILHLDNKAYNKTSNPNRLMTPFAGEPQHHPGPITLGILEDIGWNIIDLPLATFTKSALANSVEGGQALTYTLTVTNTGYLLMTDVTMTDTVPASTTLNTASCESGDVNTSGTAPGSLITWTTNMTLSTLNTVSCTFAVTVSLGSGVSTITNTAFVTSSAGVGANDTVLVTVVNSNGSNVYLPIILVNGN